MRHFWRADVNCLQIAMETQCKRIDFVVLSWNKTKEWFKRLGAVDLTTTEQWHLHRLCSGDIERLAAAAASSPASGATGDEQWRLHCTRCRDSKMPGCSGHKRVNWRSDIRKAGECISVVKSLSMWFSWPWAYALCRLLTSSNRTSSLRNVHGHWFVCVFKMRNVSSSKDSPDWLTVLDCVRIVCTLRGQTFVYDRTLLT